MKDQIKEIDLQSVRLSDQNPRGAVNTMTPAFKDLLASIKGSGVQVPVPVRPVGALFELLAGYRRYTAAKLAGLAAIPAIVKTGISDQEAFNITFTENFAREDLTTLEQARAVSMLLDRFAGNVDSVASKMGWAPSAVRLRLRLNELSPRAKKSMEDPEDEFSQASPAQLEVFARLPHVTQDHIIENRNQIFFDWNDKPKSPAEIKKTLNLYTRLVSATPWDRAVAGIARKTSCAKCKNRSDHENLLPLFQGDGDAGKKAAAGRCLDPVCWGEKLAVYVRDKKAAALKEHKDLALGVDGDAGDVDDARDFAREESAALIPGYGREKPAKGCKPVLILNGPKAGQVRYFKAGEKGKGRPAAGGVKEFVPLKNRHKALISKRFVETMARFRNRLAKIDFKASGLAADQVFKLAAIFGMEKREIYAGNPRGLWAKYEAAGVAGAALAAWPAVRGILVDRLKYMGGVTQLAPYYIDEMKRAAGLVKFDIEALFKQVASEKGFTVPKSWAGLNPDGSPKKAGKKAPAGGGKAKPAKKAKKREKK